MECRGDSDDDDDDTDLAGLGTLASLVSGSSLMSASGTSRPSTSYDERRLRRRLGLVWLRMLLRKLLGKKSVCKPRWPLLCSAAVAASVSAAASAARADADADGDADGDRDDSAPDGFSVVANTMWSARTRERCSTGRSFEESASCPMLSLRSMVKALVGCRFVREREDLGIIVREKTAATAEAR